MARRGPSEQYVLNPEQVRLLVATANAGELEDRVLVKTPLYVGLRIGELVHLRGGWLAGYKELRIPTSAYCTCQECLKHQGVWTPKTRAGARVVPLTGPVRDDLVNFLMTQPNGLGYSRFVALRRIKKLMKRSGLRIANLGQGTAFAHALRATCASLLAAGGLNEAQICYVMGWSSLDTARRYVRLAAARSNAAQAMEKAFE